MRPPSVQRRLSALGRKRIALSLRTHVTVVYLTVVSCTALITSTANVGLNPKPAGAKKIRGRTLDVEVQIGGQVKTTPVKRKGLTHGHSPGGRGFSALVES